ncbi:MAG: TIGR01906 family membrane protein [Clostridia bacterium]|nr:TIGR01906 family membrane protein [Clostridia bacterium]
MKTSKIWSICLAFCGIIFIIAFSIALPIWLRFFYYAQIDSLGIVESSGFTREQIIKAYDDVLNYLNFGTPFATGELKYSESGKNHFVDCKFLFDLDTWAMVISGIVLLTAIFLRKFKVLKPAKLLKFDWFFFSGVFAVVVPIVLGVAVAVDFDNAFVVFHKIFFPGKDNWMFNWNEDQIIRILPAEFFMNCAIFIAVALLVLAITSITVGIINRVKLKHIEKHIAEI